MLSRLLLFATVTGLACSHAAGTGGAGSDTAPTPSRVHGGSNLITAEELAVLSVSTLEDAIRRLHPGWLLMKQTALRADRQEPVVVYQDRIRLGGPETLREIMAADVKEVRYYSASEATALFGPGHLNGAIQVILVTGR
jgi:hypothetical protein